MDLALVATKRDPAVATFLARWVSVACCPTIFNGATRHLSVWPVRPAGARSRPEKRVLMPLFPATIRHRYAPSALEPLRHPRGLDLSKGVLSSTFVESPCYYNSRGAVHEDALNCQCPTRNMPLET